MQERRGHTSIRDTDHAAEKKKLNINPSYQLVPKKHKHREHFYLHRNLKKTPINKRVSLLHRHNQVASHDLHRLTLVINWMFVFSSLDEVTSPNRSTPIELTGNDHSRAVSSSSGNILEIRGFFPVKEGLDFITAVTKLNHFIMEE